MSTAPKILRIDASARVEASVTRQLVDRIEARLAPESVTTRDLISDPLPLLSPEWLAANWTPEADRTAEQKETLALSDALIAEIEAADTLIIGAPIYNFGIPAALKAWIDLIARAGHTFNYTENGPVGLLEGKRAIIAVASGGTPFGSEIDFASGYLRHVMGFIGITDVTFVAADRTAIDLEAAVAKAEGEVDQLAA